MWRVLHEQGGARSQVYQGAEQRARDVYEQEVKKLRSGTLSLYQPGRGMPVEQCAKPSYRPRVEVAEGYEGGKEPPPIRVVPPDQEALRGFIPIDSNPIEEKLTQEAPPPKKVLKGKIERNWPGCDSPDGCPNDTGAGVQSTQSSEEARKYNSAAEMYLQTSLDPHNCEVRIEQHEHDGPIQRVELSLVPTYADLLAFIRKTMWKGKRSLYTWSIFDNNQVTWATGEIVVGAWDHRVLANSLQMYLETNSLKKHLENEADQRRSTRSTAPARSSTEITSLLKELDVVNDSLEYSRILHDTLISHREYLISLIKNSKDLTFFVRETWVSLTKVMNVIDQTFVASDYETTENADTAELASKDLRVIGKNILRLELSIKSLENRRTVLLGDISNKSSSGLPQDLIEQTLSYVSGLVPDEAQKT